MLCKRNVGEFEAWASQRRLTTASEAYLPVTAVTGIPTKGGKEEGAKTAASQPEKQTSS